MGDLRGHSKCLGHFCFAAFKERGRENNNKSQTSLVLQNTCKKGKDHTHPWVCDAARLHQYDPLQEFDSGKLHASLGIRRPHKLDDPVLRARERFPLRPFILIRTPVFKLKAGQGAWGRGEGIKNIISSWGGSRKVLSRVTHIRRKRSGYAPAKVCTAILTVQAVLSFNRPASTSKDWNATKKFEKKKWE